MSDALKSAYQMHLGHSNKLEDIPNIGKSIAGDLRSLGINTHAELTARDPLQTYLALSDKMGKRHDPCVLYTLLAAQHFLLCGESMPWWKFTAQGQVLLKAIK
jgi:DNA transformation protein